MSLFLKGYNEALIGVTDDEARQDELSAILETKLKDAINYKQRIGVQCRLYEAWHAAQGKYTPQALCKLAENKSPQVYYALFAQQRRTGLAWYEDLVSQIKEKPWTLEPTPVATLPKTAKDQIVQKVLQDIITGSEQVSRKNMREALTSEQKLTLRMLQQKASSIADRATTVIYDQLAEGGWTREFKQFRSDLFEYCNAFILAPEVTSERKMQWSGDKVKSVQQTVMNVRCVSPFSVFPMPDCTTPQNGEGVWIIDEVPRNALIGLQDADGSIPDAIDEILKTQDKGWFAGSAYREDNKFEADGSYYQSRTILGVEENSMSYSICKFFGDLRQSALVDKNGKTIVKLQKIDKDMPTIPVEIWLCAGKMIRAVRNNHPEGKRPLFTSSYERKPRSFWGGGIFDILKDTELKINKINRELVKHVGSTMGYFGELDTARIGRNPIGNEVPLNTILKTDGDYTRGGHSALKFHDIPSKIMDAITLIGHYEREGESLTGIRRFMSGATDLGVAGRTNGVVNALQTNSTKLIVAVQGDVNTEVIAPLVDFYYKLNLTYGTDQSIKGDLEVIVRGSDGLAQREIFDRKLETMLQYGSSWATAVGPDGQTFIDARDFKAMIADYFAANGRELVYTIRPEEAEQLTPQGQLGDGRMPGIDGRSAPANLSGGFAPIPAQ